MTRVLVSDILALLELFEGRVLDREAHAWVKELAADQDRWPEAHDVFDRVRRRTLEAIEKKDHIRASQYGFDEICLKTLYNETATDVPFDSEVPHWITKSALRFARAVGIPESEVIDVIAPNEENA
jgi:hypothetical protein